MSSPEDDDAPKSGVRHHLILRPSEFPVTRITSDSLDSEDTEDSDGEDGIDLPQSTRHPSWNLSKDWLQEVLAEHLCENEDEREAFTIIQYSVRAGSDPVSCHRHPTHEAPHESGFVIGDSALSEVIAVSVEFRTNTEKNIELVIKLPPRDPVSRFFVTEAQFDLREIKFYTEVVPELLTVLGSANAGAAELPIPRCLHATYRAAPHHSVLILENLKSRGYHGANFATGLSLVQTRAAIRSLARIHALSLVLKVRDGADLPKKYPFLFRTSAATDSYQQLVERGLPQLARFLHRRGALGLEAAPTDTPFGDYGQILEALTSLRTRTRSVIASLLAPREPLSLITHTDFWCSNLLFRAATDEESEPQCAILDWQMITYSHPANDLALLITSSLDAGVRRQHTPALLDFYLACLAQQCAPLGVHLAQLGYTGAMLRDDFRRSQLLALLLCIGSVDVALGDTRTEERLLHVLKDLYDDGVLTDTMLTDLE